jgi:hypothetical protein
MNKNLVSELVKVANSLDNMGLSKEANSLDKIARKIVVSKEESSSDYRTDIEYYKQLFRDNLLQSATDLFNSVMKNRNYSNEQKDAFRKQAEGIRLRHYGGYDAQTGEDKLTNLLNASPFTPIKPGVLSADTDLKEFTDYWINNIQPKFIDNTSDPRYVKWLSNKFLLYKKSVLQAQKRNKEEEDSGKNWWQRTFGK